MSAPFPLPYRTAPDTLDAIRADLARLAAQSFALAAGDAGAPAAESVPQCTTPAMRRRTRFGSLSFVEIADRLTGGRS